MSDIQNLEPKAVWQIFDEITKIPRPSKKEEQIRAYLREFAAKHNFELKEDAKGNIVIKKPATPGMENHTPVVMQSHVDMVCEKDADKVHDFEKDPIETYIDNGWVKARGTTLGADCGIGMALQMAVLVAEGVEHPAIEALFTVDEEMGLTGAMDLADDMLTHKRMINLDSEDEGEIFIGCAGGIDTISTYLIDFKKLKAKHYHTLEVGVSGLKGGHSGDDINKGRANANKVLARLLWLLTEEFGAKLVEIDGGNLRNAIAREASAKIVLADKYDLDAMQCEFAKLAAEIADEYSITEPDMNLTLTLAEGEYNKTFSRTFTTLMLSAVLGVQNGIIEMSAAMPGLVETSTNLASIKMRKEFLEVVTSQRSSVQSARDAVARSVAQVFMLSGAKVYHSDGYPGWKPNPSSEFVQQSAQLYRDMFGQEPKVRAIHAGLECGLFLTKYPELDIISTGPTLRDVHSPSERLEIASLDKAWKYLLGLLKLQ